MLKKFATSVRIKRKRSARLSTKTSLKPVLASYTAERSRRNRYEDLRIQWHPERQPECHLSDDQRSPARHPVGRGGDGARKKTQGMVWRSTRFYGFGAGRRRTCICPLGGAIPGWVLQIIGGEPDFSKVMLSGSTGPWVVLAVLTIILADFFFFFFFRGEGGRSYRPENLKDVPNLRVEPLVAWAIGTAVGFII